MIRWTYINGIECDGLQDIADSSDLGTASEFDHDSENDPGRSDSLNSMKQR